MKPERTSTRRMVVTALFSAVLCILSPLTIPLGVVHFSLANFVICLAAWLLPPKLAVQSVAIYLAIGAAGLPVFSGYGVGLAKLLGPTGGYLLGYLVLAWFGGLAVKKSAGQPIVSAAGLWLGILVSYGIGTAWFMLQMSCTLQAALAMCVYPFVLFDLVKVAAACALGALLRRRLAQAGIL